MINNTLLCESNIRKTNRETVQKQPVWDLVIIGGGCVGAGILLDATLRGLKVLLLEKFDYATGTSSRSSKLLHGGVRYLAQGNFPLIREALKERKIAIENAPHLAHFAGFVIPCDNIFMTYYYAFGMKIYDFLSGKFCYKKSHIVNKNSDGSQLVGIKPASGVVRYYDGIFNDSRLALALIHTARKAGGVALNYCGVTKISEIQNEVTLSVYDEINNQPLEIKSRAIVHTAGVWSEDLIKNTKELASSGDLNKFAHLTISRGTHIVVPFTGCADAVLMPKTPDGRVLFLIPWQGKTLIGTTDIPCTQAEYSPAPNNDDVEWLIKTANILLAKPICKNDVLSVFTGYRPLVQKPKQVHTTNTAKISREHLIEQLTPRTLRILGGKWTTYRKMAQDVVEFARAKNLLPQISDCQTQNYKLYANEIVDINGDKTTWSEKIIEVINNEDVACVDDVLSRRLRLSFTDTKLAQELAPLVAQKIAEKIKVEDKTEKLLSDYNILLKQYLVPN